MLRIEDTDRERSTQQAIDTIFQTLEWLGLPWDEPPVFQFARAPRHAEVAHQLVADGTAYYCYCSKEELETMRKEALAHGLSPRYNGLWRYRSSTDALVGIPPVIRFKAPQEGITRIKDWVQGDVEIENAQLDDMVLLRADGTPTYMLSVVVDDHDMGITHIIRGDDHLTNTFRQYHLYKACGWDVPQFAHIPLIHGPDGAKLSKRHGALGAEQYKDMGFLPEAMCNYLLRLGWAHGDDEVIPREQAIAWFDIGAVGRSPARFDRVKLTSLNSYYIRTKNNADLLQEMLPFLKKICGDCAPSDLEKGLERINQGFNGLKERAKTLEELAQNALFFVQRPIFQTDHPQHAFLEKGKEARIHAQEYLQKQTDLIAAWTVFEHEPIETALRDFCQQNAIKIGEFLAPLRLALTGSTVSQSLFEILSVLGKEESLLRLKLYQDFFAQL